MRATWSGMISFGLVNIPVKVYNAARDEQISFHQMHKADDGRVSYQKVCKACGETLGQDDIVKGYEYEKGRYVIVTDEELDRIDLKTAKTITVEHFVDSREIDTLQYEKAYYIGPDNNGEGAYALLREALRRADKVGIGKVTLHSHEQLAAVRVDEDALVLETLHFCEEMVKPEGMGIPAADFKVADDQLDLAKVLIEHMTAEFDPARYHDEYGKALREMIKAKIEGEEVVAPPEVQPTNVIDIMSALKKSLEAAETGGDGAKKKVAKRKAA
jgi:DNA end-binding protein Ku